tara:strand:- start:6256 stop:6855 length:600 start_codon:yes stop_codon:yes gene_type:complete
VALTTTAKVKTYLGISSSGDDTLIGDLIANAQSIIESYTGRVFDVSGDTTKKFDAKLDVDGRMLYFSDQLEIAAAPTTVTNGDGSTLTADTDFVYLPRNRFPAYGLELLPSSSAWWQGNSSGNDANAISIVAKWGYSVSGSVPADIQQACIRLTAFLYRQRETNSDGDRPLIVDGVTILPSALPRDVTRILSPYIMRAY